MAVWTVRNQYLVLSTGYSEFEGRSTSKPSENAGDCDETGHLWPTGHRAAPSNPGEPAMPKSLACSILALVLSVGAAAQVSVSVHPKTAGLTFTQTQQFTATVSNTTNKSVRWTVDGVTGGNSTVGTISSSGLYTPPHSLGTHTVRGISLADSTKSGTAKVIMTNYSGLFTWHNNNSRNGLNSKEVVLTTANVKSSLFGKLFSRNVVGKMYEP